MTKLYLYLSIFFLSISCVDAQKHTITGTLIDSGNNAIEFIQVALLRKDSTMVAVDYSDKKGAFQLSVDGGEYIMRISSIGKILLLRNIQISSNQLLKPIQINRPVVQLGEVTINQNKNLFERKIDRLVFDVENSSKSSSGNAIDVLQVTPGIEVSNDQVSLIGKSTMRVMVNDKLILLSGDELSNYLSSIPAQDIKNIEVITTPPAKYDAEGNSGLININLKKAKANAWNAQLYTIYTQRQDASYSPGVVFDYNKNKLSLSAAASFRDGIYNQEQYSETYYPNQIWRNQFPFSRDYHANDIRADLEYKITPNWSIGGQYLHNSYDRNINDKSQTTIDDISTNSLISTFASPDNIINNSALNSFNVNNTIKLDSLNKKMTLDFDYFDFRADILSTYQGNYFEDQTAPEQFYNGINGNIQSIKNYSIRLDFVMPAKFANIDFGTKYTFTKTTDNLKFFNSGLVDQLSDDMPLTYNDFRYNEGIEALYFSINKNISKKVSLKIGLRAEQTQTESASENLNFNKSNNYLKLFPTFYLSYKPGEDLTYTLSYNRRIDRPGFNSLNPNINYTSPFFSTQGNAFLQPDYSDNVELTQNFKNFTTAIYYTAEYNASAPIGLPNAQTMVIQNTVLNYINRQSMGLNGTYLFNRISWWSNTDVIDFSYNITSFNLEEYHPNLDGWIAKIRTDNDFNFNKDKTFTGGFSFSYIFPAVWRIYNLKSDNNLNLNFKYLLFNKSLSLSLQLNDIYRSNALQQTSTVNGVLQNARYYFDTQSINLTVSYRFGNNKIKGKKIASGNSSERNRAQ